MEIEYNYYLNSKPDKRDHKFPYNQKKKKFTQFSIVLYMISISTINILLIFFRPASFLNENGLAKFRMFICVKVLDFHFDNLVMNAWSNSPH